jgi:AcrR family transcriptional regulator
MNSARKRQGAYHHGDLRETLMSAAVVHIEAGGTEKLSLRALAREAGVSPTAPYRHFPTKTCLLAALATEGFQELGASAERVVQGRFDNARARLVALGSGYVEYALAQPVKYRLMFGGVLTDFSAYEELVIAAEACYQRVLHVIAEGIERGEFIDAPANELGAATWSAFHGIASLLIDKSSNADRRVDSAAMGALRHLRGHYTEAIEVLTRGLARGQGTSG